MVGKIRHDRDQLPNTPRPARASNKTTHHDGTMGCTEALLHRETSSSSSSSSSSSKSAALPRNSKLSGTHAPMSQNPDPLTGEPGSHPVATGLGAAAASAAGLAIGTAVAGPVGTVIGG